MIDDADVFLADPEATWRELDLADARDCFADFCGLIEIPGAPLREAEDCEEFKPLPKAEAAHLVLLHSVLQKVESGEIKRLMVFMPPGGAKSSYCSVCFPAWFMGRQPRRNVIMATYGADLARKHGRKARAVVRQPIYRDVFGVGLSAETSAADEWALENANEFIAVGIQGGVTGNRADLIVVDDPIKGRQEADSETIRNSTWDEWTASVRTRLKPNGRIVIVQTRWHEDDLAGRILPSDYDGQSGWISGRDGEAWFVICIPAEAERLDDPLGRAPGELFWPEWFPEDHWTPFRADARTWSSLYQQRPSPAQGTFFQREWFKRFAVRPTTLRVYMTSDHAPTDGKNADFSVVRVWGVDPDGDLYLLDGFRHQATMDVTASRAFELVKRYKPFAWFPEDDNNWKSAAPFIQRQMRERGVFCRIEPISPHGHDKAAKAAAFQGMAAMGKVHLPEGPNGDGILEQYLKFPAGAHDDEVDAAGIIGRALDMAHPAIIPPKAPDMIQVMTPRGPTLQRRDPRLNPTFNELFSRPKPAPARI